MKNSIFLGCLFTFDNIDLLEVKEFDLPETLHLRDIPNEQLVIIWQAVVHSDKTSLVGHPWKVLSDIPPYIRDYYRDRATQSA